jgi:thioredoxin reductase
VEQSWDVVVVGGGAAGLSTALTLARARRRVVVVDSGMPRNAPAGGVHGYLGCEGTAPAELLARGREEAARYGATTVDGTAVSVQHVGDGTVPSFAVRTEAGEVLHARRVVLTTGLSDELPEVDGVRERWGRDVLHCPYCHGWETRDRPIGMLASGPSAAEEALLLRQWSDDVVLFLHEQPAPDEETGERLEAMGVRVVHGALAALVVEADRLCGVRLRSGEVVPRETLVVQPRLVPRDDLLAGRLDRLGLTPEVQRDGPVVCGTFVRSDSGVTDVAGLYVAGNLADPAAEVVTAASSGVRAATAVNIDLVREDVDAAVARRRAGRGAAAR